MISRLLMPALVVLFFVTWALAMYWNWRVG
jgi:hypothetical protein